MNEEFRGKIKQLPSLMEQLINSPLKSRGNMANLPQKGIYVFYENEHPKYVGRTNRMKKRIMEHSRPSSRYNKAQFAYKLAKKDAIEKGIANEKSINYGKKSGELETNPAFVELFLKAKEKVSRMPFRVIEINDPIIQTIFEVYAHIDLKTEFNDFDNH